MQAQAQIFWKRWSSEYFPQCQRRGKWTKITRNIEAEDLAILKNDNSPPLQWDQVRVIKVCLFHGHMTNVCRSTYNRRTCKRKHHSLLHFEKQQGAEEKEQPDRHQTNKSQSSSTSGVLIAAPVPVGESKRSLHIFLATALVTVRDKNGKHHQCRAILDSGSQVNFISTRFANLLQLVCQKSSLPISGIGDNRLNVKSCSELDIESRTSNFSIKFACYVLPNIVGELASYPQHTGG